MTSFNLQTDPSSPVPLYHQIAEALRYRIATGVIPIGSVLPPLRDAALLWRVNLHTVRRAYAELAAAGIVETRATVGTQVLPSARAREGAATRASARAAFAKRVIDQARARHGLSLPQLLALLESQRPPVAGIAGATVHVVECSASQAADLARQLEEEWRVRAIPWTIDQQEPPRPGAIVATYFHYNDLHARWPGRFRDIRFAAISPDPTLRARVLAAMSDGGQRQRASRRITVVLCERDDAMLWNIAADVCRILPARQFRLKTRLVRDAASILKGIGPHTPVLVAPRVWGDLPATLREDPRIHEVRYLFDPDSLSAIGRNLGWAPQQEA
jgi:GntR family transcriptional regulator